MGLSESTSSVKSDVLHFENQSKLSAEEIAKALAHHNRHHHGDQPAQAAAKMAAAKQNSGKKNR